GRERSIRARLSSTSSLSGSPWKPKKVRRRRDGDARWLGAISDRAQQGTPPSTDDPWTARLGCARRPRAQSVLESGPMRSPKAVIMVVLLAAGCTRTPTGPTEEETRTRARAALAPF